MFCLSVSLFHLTIHSSIQQYIYLSIHLSHLSIYLSIHQSIYTPFHLSIYRPFHLSIYPSIHQSIYTPTHLYTNPSIHKSIDPFIDLSLSLSCTVALFLFPLNSLSLTHIGMPALSANALSVPHSVSQSVSIRDYYFILSHLKRLSNLCFRACKKRTRSSRSRSRPRRS
jgi:hypothetical protein